MLSYHDEKVRIYISLPFNSYDYQNIPVSAVLLFWPFASTTHAPKLIVGIDLVLAHVVRYVYMGNSGLR